MSTMKQQESYVERVDTNDVMDIEMSKSIDIRGLDEAQRIIGHGELHDLNVTEEEMRKVVRKTDWAILPYLAVCYMFYYIDKTTLSYSAIFGMKEDLNLVGTEYSWLSSVFYFGYLFWAIPTNYFLLRLPVGKYLGFNIMLWGVFLMLQAACKSFASLTVLRVLGGAVEATADPAFMLITSMW
ncbi:allantoate permease [Sugiyamaella lignohabitans]|uniref:Allantoate permease n=1 Tax=Sugiyamaella lignohabitans TaxID=796027 RepID=A0A167CDH5_9ASCO|nr:allantoate permease [Sugiyamaella lignohabitans]ANB11552.1 allantoate permease [Sugiyamaella lignohabitans]